MEYVLKHYEIGELTVNQTNKIAIELYKKFGFYVDFPFEENGDKMFDMKYNKNARVV